MLQMLPHGSTFEQPVAVSFDLKSMVAGMEDGEEGVDNQGEGPQRWWLFELTNAVQVTEGWVRVLWKDIWNSKYFFVM